MVEAIVTKNTATSRVCHFLLEEIMKYLMNRYLQEFRGERVEVETEVEVEVEDKVKAEKEQHESVNI